MGLFTRKKKSVPSSIRSAPSPSASFSTICPSPPVSPVVAYFPSQPFFNPQITLRVALDPAPIDAANSVFTITIDHDADIGRVRSAIAETIGHTSTSLFKVSIPLLAHFQAREYQERFSTPVNLLTSFPAFNLDDPRQLTASLGLAWSTSPRDLSSELRVRDWFPESTQQECISILVRTSESSTCRLTPLTFVSHFAPSPAEQQLSYRLGSSAKSTRAPAVVCVSPSQTVRELKAAVLRADGRSARDDLLDHVILWRVDMSQEEMIVIGERGGLKNGRMPWPYPPGALVPVLLANPEFAISHYFAGTKSNSNMVSLSVYLDETASAGMPWVTPPSSMQPPFRFPMTFSENIVGATPMRSTSRRSRQRPSTAPAASESQTTRFPLSTLAACPQSARLPELYPTARPRVASPLSSTAVPTRRGLGINLPEISTRRSITSPDLPTLGPITRGSMSSSCSSTDEHSTPSLSFSRLSLTLDPMDKAGPHTPEVYDTDVLDWLQKRDAISKKNEGFEGQPRRKMAFA